MKKKKCKVTCWTFFALCILLIIKISDAITEIWMYFFSKQER